MATKNRAAAKANEEKQNKPPGKPKAKAKPHLEDKGHWAMGSQAEAAPFMPPEGNIFGRPALLHLHAPGCPRSAPIRSRNRMRSSGPLAALKWTVACCVAFASRACPSMASSPPSPTWVPRQRRFAAARLAPHGAHLCSEAWRLCVARCRRSPSLAKRVHDARWRNRPCLCGRDAWSLARFSVGGVAPPTLGWSCVGCPSLAEVSREEGVSPLVQASYPKATEIARPVVQCTQGWACTRRLATFLDIRACRSRCAGEPGLLPAVCGSLLANPCVSKGCAQGMAMCS